MRVKCSVPSLLQLLLALYVLSIPCIHCLPDGAHVLSSTSTASPPSAPASNATMPPVAPPPWSNLYGLGPSENGFVLQLVEQQAGDSMGAVLEQTSGFGTSLVMAQGLCAVDVKNRVAFAIAGNATVQPVKIEAVSININSGVITSVSELPFLAGVFFGPGMAIGFYKDFLSLVGRDTSTGMHHAYRLGIQTSHQQLHRGPVIADSSVDVMGGFSVVDTERAVHWVALAVNSTTKNDAVVRAFGLSLEELRFGTTLHEVTITVNGSACGIAGLRYSRKRSALIGVAATESVDKDEILFKIVSCDPVHAHRSGNWDCDILDSVPGIQTLIGGVVAWDDASETLFFEGVLEGSQGVHPGGLLGQQKKGVHSVPGIIWSGVTGKDRQQVQRGWEDDGQLPPANLFSWQAGHLDHRRACSEFPKCPWNLMYV